MDVGLIVDVAFDGAPVLFVSVEFGFDGGLVAGTSVVPVALVALVLDKVVARVVGDTVGASVVAELQFRQVVLHVAGISE